MEAFPVDPRCASLCTDTCIADATQWLEGAYSRGQYHASEASKSRDNLGHALSLALYSDERYHRELIAHLVRQPVAVSRHARAVDEKMLQAAADFYQRVVFVMHIDWDDSLEHVVSYPPHEPVVKCQLRDALVLRLVQGSYASLYMHAATSEAVNHPNGHLLSQVFEACVATRDCATDKGLFCYSGMCMDEQVISEIPSQASLTQAAEVYRVNLNQALQGIGEGRAGTQGLLQSCDRSRDCDASLRLFCDTGLCMNDSMLRKESQLESKAGPNSPDDIVQ